LYAFVFLLKSLSISRSFYLSTAYIFLTKSGLTYKMS